MKLKYILPVATIASVAAAVTPLAVSCSCSSWDYTWDFKKKGSYTSKVTQAPSTLSQDKLTQTYFDDLANNHQIIADDIFCGFNEQYEQLIEGPSKDSTTINSFVAKVSVTSIDTKSHLLSMRYLMDMDVVMEIPGEDEPSVMKIYSDISVKNIEYEVAWDDDSDLNEACWQFQTTVYDFSIEEIDKIIDTLNKHDGWSLSGKYGFEGGSAGEEFAPYEFDFNKSKLPSTDEKDIEAFGVAVDFGMPSHYLAKVPHE